MGSQAVGLPAMGRQEVREDSQVHQAQLRTVCQLALHLTLGLVATAKAMSALRHCKLVCRNLQPCQSNVMRLLTR